MTEFKGGQTVYDSNGKMFEFHHEHNGVFYVYPLFEFQGEHGEWFDASGDMMLGLSAVFAEPPTPKLSEKVVDLSNQIDELKVKAAEHRGAADAARRDYDQQARIMEQWLEKHHFMKMIGMMLDGEQLYFTIIHANDWTPPSTLDKRDVQVTKLKWDPRQKRYFFAKARRGIVDGDDTLHAFETQDALHNFVEAMFLERCKEVRLPITPHRNAFDPARDYTTPHIKALRKWVAKWPHLEIPQDILDAEAEYLVEKKRQEIETAAKRLAELQSDG